jgi:protein gp37
MIRGGKEFKVLRPTRGPWREAELLNANAEARKTHELVFTCSLSDFFHPEADIWRDEAWDVIRHCENLIWLILTKRPERIRECLPPDWNDGKRFPHVWLGVTCGARKSFGRVETLRKVPCALRFLSCEPLIEDISELDLSGIGWVLCGGMSGKLSTKYPMDLRWAASLYDASQKAGVPFLFKQVSHNMTERGINALGMYLSGGTGTMSSKECIREYPKTGLQFAQPEPQGTYWSVDDFKKHSTQQLTGSANY